MKSKKMMTIICAALSLLLAIITAFIIYQCFWSPITIYGVDCSRAAKELDISGTDLSSDATQLLKLSRLKKANLTNTNISPEQYDFLCTNMPNCDIKWSVPLNGKTYPSDISTLVLDASTAPSELKNIKYFTKLKSLDVSQYAFCDELYQAIADTKGEYKLIASLCGAEITSDTTELDLSSHKVSDCSELYEKLKYFPSLKKLFAGSCDISDEEMDKLNQAFPDIDIVWLVKFGKWQVRTDAKVFSTLVRYKKYDAYPDEEFYPLFRYCRELVALDLGHNPLHSLAPLTTLKKLEVLVVVDSFITDLSPLKELPKLHYLELWNCTMIEDVSPLGECSNLQEVEMSCMGNVKGLAALQKCKKLKMIFGNYTIPTDYSWDKMREAMPDCWINSTLANYAGGWRSTDKNMLITTAFANWDKIVSFDGWDNITYKNQSVFPHRYACNDYPDRPKDYQKY